jgi:uncharacterized membrane protein YccC
MPSVPITEPAASIASEKPASRQTVESKWRAFWGLVTRFDSSKTSFAIGFRNALGVSLPMAAGVMLSKPLGGLATGSGALCVAYADGHDPYRQRAVRLILRTIFVSLAVMVGGLSARNSLIAVAVASAAAFAAGMAVAIGESASDTGIISVVLIVIYAAQPLTLSRELEAAGLAFLGGLIIVVLSLLFWPVQKFQPERRALAELFRELARRAELPVDPRESPPASAQSSSAHQALENLRYVSGIQSERYRSLLTQAERLRLAIFTLKRLRTRLEREQIPGDQLQLLKDFLNKTSIVQNAVAQILLRESSVQPTAAVLAELEAIAQQWRSANTSMGKGFLSATRKDALFQMEAIGGQLRASVQLASSATTQGSTEFERREARQPWRLRLEGVRAQLRANLTPGSVIFRHALRVAICVGIGDALGRTLDWHRAYWIPMTTMLVLRPDFASTFSRGVLRIAGTIIGLAVSTALLYFLPHSFVLHVGFIAIFVLLLRWIGPANYGLFVIFVTSVIVLMISFTGISPSRAIWARGMDTLLGGAIALIGYAVWPTWERGSAALRLADMLLAYRDYFDAVAQFYLSPKPMDSVEREQLRLQARRARSNFEALVDRLSAEPATPPEELESLRGILASSHRFVHANMALEAGSPVKLSSSALQALEKFAGDVREILDALVSVLRKEKPPPRRWPDLREDYRLFVASAEGGFGRDSLPAMEADRIVNSLNTLKEQILGWRS